MVALCLEIERCPVNSCRVDFSPKVQFMLSRLDLAVFRTGIVTMMMMMMMMMMPLMIIA